MKKQFLVAISKPKYGFNGYSCGLVFGYRYGAVLAIGS